MKKIALVALLSAVVATPVMAAETGFYAGANLGMASTSYANLSSNTGTAVSFLGGYQINKNFAVEAAYHDFGSIKPTANSSFKITGYGVSAVGILPMDAQWSLLGKLGVASTSIAITPTKADNTSLSFGIGAQYNLNKNIGIRAGYDLYAVGNTNTNTNTATTSVLSVGGVYNF